MNRIATLAAALAAAAFCAPILPQESAAAVDWQWSATAVTGAGGKTYELRFSGRIADGYVVYASDFNVDIGPRPTRLRLDDAAHVTPQGTLLSTGAHSKKDPAFKGEYRYFDGTAALSQQVVVKDGTAHVTGALVGQTCREADGTCQLFNQRFDIALP
jgi:Disulphide bond corrector protein DsbC